MDAHELQWLRDDIETLLPDTCHILSATRTSNGMGGWSETWGTADPFIPCRLDTVRGKIQVAGGALQTYTSLMLTIPADTEISAFNRVSHGESTYKVKTVTAGSWMGCLRVEVEKI